MTTDRVEFAPPGGGSWELETVHTRGAVPVAFQEFFPPAMKEGFRRSGAAYGLPLDFIDIRFVADHCYGRAVPVGAPEPKPGKASTAPPSFVLKVLSRLHPELRRRRRAAAETLATRRWVADRERWENVMKPARIEVNRELQRIDPATLGDVELAAHLRACINAARAGTVEHFELLGAYGLPLGRFVAACDGWGIGRKEALDLLAGHSPASSLVRELEAVADACAAAHVEPTSLDEIRAASPDAREALERVLADHGSRIVTEYTPRGSTLNELPALLVGAIRRAGAARATEHVDRSGELRRRVPAAERDRFDELLADARAATGVRDDNVGPCCMWPIGLVRRALIEAGRRLVARGVAAHDEDALWISTADIVATLEDRSTLTADAVATRVASVAAAEAAGAPTRLGPSEGAPPDPAVFGGAMAEVMRAFFVVLELEMPGRGTIPDGDGEHLLRGVGVGDQVVRARAVVATDVDDAADRLEPGDVLVTVLTTPAFNAVLAMCGGVVTEEGGLLSHTALVAREMGIPAVCGVARACSRIPDGAQVEVDGGSGEVRVLAPTV